MSFELKNERMWEQLFLTPAGSTARGASGSEANSPTHEEDDMMGEHSHTNEQNGRSTY